MYFDFVRNLKIPNKFDTFGLSPELYDHCISAMQSARTDPDAAMLSIRKALEVLMRGLLRADGQDIRGLNLNKKMEKYEEGCSFIEDKQYEKLDKLRVKVNPYLHDDQSRPPHTTSEIACNCLEELYDILAAVFQQEGVPAFQQKKLPIGKYEITELLPVKPYEAVDGGFDYIGKESNSAAERYAFIRPFRNSDKADQIFSQRDIDAQSFFDNLPASPYIMKGQEIAAKDYCEWRYLAYSINRDTKRLEDITRELSPLDLLNIISQTATGLIDISTHSVPDIYICHRNITPNCIFVNSYNGEYEARLGCFETAKIVCSEWPVGTVLPYMVESLINNKFIHPQIIQKITNNKEISIQEWAAGDVFSLAAVLLFCRDQDAVLKRDMDCSALSECYSDEFTEEMVKILTNGSLLVVPSTDSFLELLDYEKELLDGTDESGS